MHIAHLFKFLRGIYFANNTNSVIYFQGLLDSVSDYACRNKLKAIEIYETAKFKPPENLHENSKYFIHSNIQCICENFYAHAYACMLK